MTTIRRTLAGIAWAAAVSLVLAGTAVAATSTSTTESKEKDRLELYLVISPHAPSQHLKVLEEMAAKEPQILDSTEWGHVGSDDVGYTMVDAKDENAAKSVVPEEIRSRAQAVRLTKYSTDEVKALEKKSESAEGEPAVASRRTARPKR